MRWFHKHLSTLSRHLLSVWVGLWLVTALAPCAMAAPACPPKGTPHAGCSQAPGTEVMDMACDGFSAVDCVSPEPVPTSAALAVDSLAPVGALLHVLPPTWSLAIAPSVSQLSRHAARIPPPPDNLRNTVLLI